MPRKTLLTAAIVTLLLGVVTLAPQVPFVRGYLLGVALRAAAAQGFQVGYATGAGNLWRGVTLQGVTVTGPGVDAEVDRVRLDYFLPALLGGELPLDVDVTGARGELDLGRLVTSVAPSGQAPAPTSTGPRVRLGHVRLADIELLASQVPFTLPDMTVTDASVEDEGGMLLLAATVTTPEGSLTASGELDLATLDLTAQVERADVTIARQWWLGARGGVASGTLTVKRGQVTGDFELTDGSIDDLGLTASGLTGPVRLAYPVISAELTGRAMGGPITATGTVNVAAMRFEARGQAAPGLEEAAAWLLRGALPGGLPLPVTGATQLDMSVSGWTGVEARGSARGAGTVGGLPLTDLDVTFAYGSTGELRVDSSAALGGGPLRLTIGPGVGAPTLRVTATSVGLAGLEYQGVAPGGTLTEAALEMDLGATQRAALTAAWEGTVPAPDAAPAGAPARLSLDARLDPDGWQVFVEGATDAYAHSGEGVELSGAVVFAGDRLDGGLNLTNVAVPGVAGPVALALKGAGPTTDVALTLDVAGAEPLRPDPAILGGVDVAADLRGRATARLKDGALGPVTGTLGPLAFEARVAGADVNATWTLAAVAVTGPGGWQGTVAASGGRLEWGTAGLAVAAAATASDLVVGPVEVGPTDLTLDLELAPGAEWELHARGEHVALAVGSATPLAATSAALPVRLAGSADWAPLSGSVAARQGGGYDVDAHLPSGSDLAGLALPAPLGLAGTVASDLGSLAASGRLGELPLDLAVDWADAGTADLTAAGLRLDYALQTGAWSATGSADAAALARGLGLSLGDVAGTVALDLTGQGAAATGPASLTVTSPVAATLTAQAAGDRAELTLAGEAAGLALSGRGHITLADPAAASMTAQLGPLDGLVITTEGVSGSGVLGGVALPTGGIAPTPWALAATWAGPAATLEVGGERLTAARAAAGWLLEGAVAAEVQYGGATYDLTVAPGAPGARRAVFTDPAALPISAALADRHGGLEVASATGPLTDLGFALGVDATTLLAPLPEAYRPDWRVAGSGTANVLAGPSYRATLTLEPGPGALDPTPVTGRLSGVGAAADLTLEGTGLYLNSEAGTEGPRLRLRATDAALDRYLPAGFGGTLVGSMISEGGTWRGALTATLEGSATAPLEASVTLVGDGDERLRVTAAATGPAGTSLTARGNLLPELRLTGQAQALDGWASTTLEYADGLSGRLVTEGTSLEGVAEVPALAFDLAFDPATGSLRLAQAPIDPADDGAAPAQDLGALTLSAGALAGEIEVPATTRAGDVLVRLGLSGPLESATASLTFEGAVMGNAVASLGAGVRADLNVPPASLVAALPELAALGGAINQPLSARLDLAQDGSWTATAAGGVEAGGVRAGLGVELAGTGLDYSGGAVLSSGGVPLASATVDGSGTVLGGSVDLGAVDWAALGDALGVQLDVSGTGLLTFSTDPPAAGLTVDLTADVAGNEARLHGTAPDDLRLSVAGPAGRLDGLLAWTTAPAGPDGAPGSGPQARLTGAFGGVPVEVVVEAPGEDQVDLRARYGEASLAARLGPAPDGAGPRQVTLQLDAPPGTALAYGASAEGTLELGESGLSVASLTATLTGLLPAGAPLTLAAAGPVTGPDGLALTGTLSTPTLKGAATFELNGQAATAGWRGLSADCGLDLARCRLSGAADPADLVELAALFPEVQGAVDALRPELVADLSWTATGGFTGSLSARATADVPALGGPLVLEAEARGDGGLTVRGTAAASGAPDPALATVDLRLSADPLSDPALGGHATLRLGVDQLAAAGRLGLTGYLAPDGVDPTVLTADLNLSGSLTAPSAAGVVNLSGPLAATGPASYDGEARAARVELTGEAVAAEALLSLGSATTWSADATLADLDLGPWLPQVIEPRLGLTLRAGPGGATLSDLQLAAGSSRITGSGELTFADPEHAAGGLRVALDADLDLADLDQGGAGLTGALRGPLALSAGDLADPASYSLSASLAATGVGVAAVDGTVGGGLTLGGTLADPLVTADLTGAGRVRGSLTASARPTGGELTLASDLAYGQLVTDLRASLRQGVAAAAGTARYGDAVLLLSNGSGAGGIVLTGAGRLAGWAADVSADLGSARLTGDLAALANGLSGAVTVALDAGGDRWLTATVQGTALGDVTIGNVTAEAVTPLSPITVTGDRLSGRLDVTGRSWTAALAPLEVGGGVTLEAGADGTFSEVRLAGTATGPDLGLDFAATAAPTAVSATLSGTAYGGALEANARREGGPWTGGLSYSGGQLAGLRLAATGTVIGEGALPQLVLSTALTDPAGDLRVAGRATASTAGITVDQVVSGGPASVPVRLQGRLAPDADVTLATLAEPPGPDSRVDLPVISQVRLRSVPGLGLLAAGAVRVDVGPARLVLTGQDSAPRLSVQLAGLPQLRAAATLDAPDLAGLLTTATREGLRFEGSESTNGAFTLALTPTPTAALHDLEVRLPGVTVKADGVVSLQEARLEGEVTLATDLPLAPEAGAPTAAGAGGITEYTLPWTLITEGGEWRLAYAGQLGRLTGTYAPGTAPDALKLDVDLRLSGGAVTAALDHRDGQLTGSLQVDDLHLLAPGLGGVVVDATGTVADGRVGGSAELVSDAGRLTVSGNWGLADLLPTGMAVGAPRGGRVDARLRNLELAEVPFLRENVPYLAGTVTGALQLRDGVVFGQFLSPELTAGGTSSAVEVAVSGGLSSVDVSLRTRGATVTANLAGDRLSGSGRFERFPAQFLAHAVVGPSDVTADVTGVLRFDMPLGDPLAGYLRLATEEVRLERTGVPTIGNVTITLDARTVQVDRAEFVGLGRWDAAGVLRPDDLDFHLEAVDADFTPLLGLFPSLARLGMGAEGSLTIDVKGDLARPSAVIASDGLDVEVAGSRYRLGGTELALEGSDLTVAAQLDGVSPLAGSLVVSGGARVDLAPFAFGAVEVGFDGSLALPGIGVVEDVTGSLTQDAAGELALGVTGRLGTGTARLAGGLLPLDLRATGEGLTVAFPALMVATAVVDADLTLRGEAGGVTLGGGITATEVIVDPGVRQPAPVATETAAPAPEQAASGLSALRFDDLAVRAPQRVLLTTNLGSGEAALDLVLSGTAAAPRLVGTASTLRGNLRFSGREFTIDRAIATFGPSTGLYPALDVAAHTELDKSRVTAADSRVSFVVPREGQTFIVNLAFTGQVEAAPDGAGGFRFDVEPRVSSDARIEVSGEGPGSGVRSFTDAELMSLLTLGRFELNAGIIGSGGLGAAVAQGALDTAVDLLVVSELANAIRQALGLDVVEIRTSALSTLLDSADQPFGVSLRLGGYLNPDLFASYRIGTYDGPDRTYSITNEVLLSYGLGPLDLDVSGRIDFPAAGVPDPPRPELGVSLSYAFSPTFALDAGVTLSTDRSAFQVGVTLRW